MSTSAITRPLADGEYEQVITALCEGMYTAYLDYPALLEEDRVLEKAFAYVDERGEGESLLVNVIAAGYMAGYRSVCSQVRAEPGQARDYAALLVGMSRRSALVLVRALCVRLFPSLTLTSGFSA